MAHAGWGRTLRRLVEGGLLEGEAAIAGRLTVEATSRSNQVGILYVDGQPVVVLKRHDITVDDVDPFLAEVAAYRWLAGNSTTETLAPRLVAVEDRVLVIEALVGLRPFHEALANSDDQPARLLEALGRQLAMLHTACPDRDALCSRRPWALGVTDGRVPEVLAPDPEIGPLMGEIAADASLRTAAEELSLAWRTTAPMHGDVKFDNILVGFNASTAEPRIVLLDWEFAGLGVPAWDLAGVLEGLIVPALQSVDIVAALKEGKHAASMIATYRSLVGPAFAPDDRSLFVATIVRLVQATIQLHAMRHLEPECAHSARRVFDGARALAEQITGGGQGPAWLA